MIVRVGMITKFIVAGVSFQKRSKRMLVKAGMIAFYTSLQRARTASNFFSRILHIHFILHVNLHDT